MKKFSIEKKIWLFWEIFWKFRKPRKFRRKKSKSWFRWKTFFCNFFFEKYFSKIFGSQKKYFFGRKNIFFDIHVDVKFCQLSISDVFKEIPALHRCVFSTFPSGTLNPCCNLPLIQASHWGWCLCTTGMLTKTHRKTEL